MARVVNFGQQVFQPATQQQSPKSILAQLLLSRGQWFNANQRGSGARAAGDLILGALLRKQGFSEQQAQNIQKAEQQKELLELFRGPSTTTRGPSQPPDETNFTASSGALTGDVAPDPVFEPEDPEMRDIVARQTANVTNQFRQPEAFSTGPALTPPPDVPGKLTTTPGQLNQTGQLLQGLIESNRRTGGVPDSVLFNALQQQQGIKREDALRQETIQRQAAAANVNRQQQLQDIGTKFDQDKELRGGLLNRRLSSEEEIARNKLKNSDVQKALDRANALEIANIRSKKPGVQVNLGGAQDPLVTEADEGAKKIGQGTGDAFVKIQNAGNSATGQLNRLTALREFGNRAGTGKLSKVKSSSLRTIDAIFGSDFSKREEVTNQQIIEMFSNRMALELRNPESGGGLTGSTSERDLTFLIESIPGIGNEDLAFDVSVELLSRFEQRKVETAKLAREFKRELIKDGDRVVKKRGQFSFSFAERLAQFNTENPMSFGDLVEKVRAATAKPKTGFSLEEYRAEIERRRLR